MSCTVRTATRSDAASIARIYSEGIEDRVATFETEPRTAADVERWLDDGFPLVVAVADGEVVGWASAAPYRAARSAYGGVGDFSIYVARDRRGQGIGRPLLAGLLDEAERRGLWKLVGRIFPENASSLGLCRSLGFRQVGVYRRHARLDGAWRDIVVVERLLGEAAD